MAAEFEPHADIRLSSPLMRADGQHSQHHSMSALGTKQEEGKMRTPKKCWEKKWANLLSFLLETNLCAAAAACCCWKATRVKAASARPAEELRVLFGSAASPLSASFSEAFGEADLLGFPCSSGTGSVRRPP
ncbi:hypothetical protein L1887_59856 [Cichorium endivia]|nr:hypothetical protein L1887_59856 [Cichorium endivia]